MTITPFALTEFEQELGLTVAQVRRVRNRAYVTQDGTRVHLEDSGAGLTHAAARMALGTNSVRFVGVNKSTGYLIYERR